jgi:hypothetical protein
MCCYKHSKNEEVECLINCLFLRKTSVKDNYFLYGSDFSTLTHWHFISGSYKKTKSHRQSLFVLPTVMPEVTRIFFFFLITSSQLRFYGINLEKTIFKLRCLVKINLMVSLSKFSPYAIFHTVNQNHILSFRILFHI